MIEREWGEKKSKPIRFLRLCGACLSVKGLQLNFVSIHNNFKHNINMSAGSRGSFVTIYNEIKCAIGVFSTWSYLNNVKCYVSTKRLCNSCLYSLLFLSLSFSCLSASFTIPKISKRLNHTENKGKKEQRPYAEYGIMHRFDLNSFAPYKVCRWKFDYFKQFKTFVIIYDGSKMFAIIFKLTSTLKLHFKALTKRKRKKEIAILRIFAAHSKRISINHRRLNISGCILNVWQNNVHLFILWFVCTVRTYIM